MNDGRLEAAEREFDEALGIFPDHALALRGKAHARLAADDIQGAVVLCKREPRSADAAQMLGDLYTLLGDEGAARKEYESLKLLNMKMQLSKDPGGTCSIIGGASNWYERRANQLSRGDYLQDSEHSR